MKKNDPLSRSELRALRTLAFQNALDELITTSRIDYHLQQAHQLLHRMEGGKYRDLQAKVLDLTDQLPDVAYELTLALGFHPDEVEFHQPPDYDELRAKFNGESWDSMGDEPYRHERPVDVLRELTRAAAAKSKAGDEG